MDKDLVDVLKSYINVDLEKCSFAEIIVQDCAFHKLRDAIWKIGNVLAEIDQQKIYVAEIKAGFLNANVAYLAVKVLQDRLDIVGYAKEGLINQNTFLKAVKKLELAIKN